MMLGQEIGEFLVRRLGEASFLPQIRGQVGVGLGDGSICGLGEVAQSGGGTTSLRVAILDTSHVQQLLGDTSGDDSSTARSWNQVVIDDLAFFDGQREEVDLFQGLDLAIFNETTQLGDRNPLFLFFLATTTASTPAAATTTASSAPSSVSETASKTSTVSTGWCCVRHWWILSF